MKTNRLALSMLFVAVAVAALGLVACSSNQSAKVQFDDTEITGAVKAAFIADPIVKALDVDVTTNEGVVVLNGRVDTPAESIQAGKLAGKVNGVKSVRNLLKVGPMPANG